MADAPGGTGSAAAPDPFRTTRGPSPLRADQLEVLKGYGQPMATEAGQVLFRAGDTTNDFLVVLEG